MSGAINAAAVGRRRGNDEAGPGARGREGHAGGGRRADDTSPEGTPPSPRSWMRASARRRRRTCPRGFLLARFLGRIRISTVARHDRTGTTDRRSCWRTRRIVVRASYHATSVRLPPRGPGARRMHDRRRRRPNKGFTWNGRVRAHRQSVKTGTSRGDVGEFARYQEMPHHPGQRRGGRAGSRHGITRS